MCSWPKKSLRFLLIFMLSIGWVFSGFSLGVREAQAAVAYVGTAEGSGNSAAYNVSLTGISMQQGDIVIVSTGFVSTADGNPGVSTAGYTEVADLYASDNNDANLSVNWKIMGSTPDTSVTCLGSGSATNGAVCVVHVWRGVDQSVPLDVTTVTAVPGNNIATSIPNSGPITPVSSGAIVIATGLGADAAADAAITAPTGYGNQADISVDPGLAAILGIASKAWSGSGAEDPDVWTNWTSTSAGSWVAVTLALRPVPPPIDSNTAVEVHGAGAQANFNLDPLKDTAGEKFSVLKFQISDKATTDALPTLIDQIIIPISGTGGNASTDIAWAEIYNDTGGAQVAVATSITNSAITFGSTPNGGGTAGLDTIASAGTIRYTLNVYMKASALTATDGQTYIFGINDSNVGEDSSGSSQMRSDASAVTSVIGTNTVTHSKIIFSTQPPSAASPNADFTGAIGVSATDANNNVDTGFTEAVTISAVIDTTHAAPTGTLSSTDSGGLTKTSASGVATWTDTKYSYAEAIDIKAVSTTYSSGIYSSAVTVSAGPAWTAYNDLAGNSLGNVTNYSSITGYTAAGYLVNYNTGTTLNTYLSVTGDPAENASFGAISNVGTDGYNYFNGKLNCQGIITYAAGDTVFTFTGLDSAKKYKFVSFGNRANNIYTDRMSKVIISDADSFTADSSTGVTITTTTTTDDSATYSTGYNTVNGYVAAWKDIKPGLDGDLVVTVTNGTHRYSNVIMLQEFAAAAATLSSAANQTFTVNQSATAISTVTITDAATPTITATNDIRIKIPTAFNMTWDTSDTLANIAGTDWDHTGAASSGGTVTVSFEDSNKTAVIPVTINFEAGDDITVYGLSFANFSATSSADNLELETNNAGTSADEDDKTITVVGASLSAAIEVRAQNYTTALTSITFPSGAPGATVSAPTNSAGNTQTFGGAGTAKPVVTLYNGGGSTLIIWYNITTFTNSVVSSENYLVNTKGAACADVSCITSAATFDANTTTGATIAVGAGNEKDFYLKINLSSVAAKSGNSTLTILGEAL